MLGRESVLKMNGSNVRGWWFAHHFLGMLLSVAVMMWPSRAAVRTPLYAFYLYLGFVQLLQYRYQMNRLYALRALSRIDPMETTNELGQNLIHHNLLFLLPWLLVAYGWELYLAWRCWRVAGGVLVAVLYATLALGNLWTTGYTYYRKLSDHRRGITTNPRILLTRSLTRSTENLTRLDENELKEENEEKEE